MKVVFITAESEGNARFTSALWPAYLKAYAEQWVDAEWAVAHSNDEMIREKPDVVAMSSMSQDWEAAGETAQIALGTGARVVVGGHHVTGVGDSTVPGVKVVSGPGEAAFASHLLTLNGAQPATARPVVGLDHIPPPDHTFGKRRGEKPALITSRGCSYKCSFCSPKLMWDKIRFHSARRVVDEIKQIRRDFPMLRRLSIWDDLFAADQRRVKDICLLMESEGVKMRLNASMRAELVTDDNCRLWDRMGLTRIGIGGESGSDRILKKLKSESSSVTKNQAALDAANRFGFAVGTGIIFGTPAETEEDVIATYEWLLKNYRAGKLMNHAVNILTPLPGTPVWVEAEQAGHVPAYSKMKWSRLKHQSMDFRTESSATRGRQGWMSLRRHDESIYLNEDTVPQEDLFEMIEHYERKIQWCSPAQILRTGKRRLERMIR